MKDQLEAAILADPSDENFAVYADWLQQQGDARGELAALQAKGVDATELIAAHEGRFVGPLARFLSKSGRDHALRIEWRHGWFDRVEVGTSAPWQVHDTDPVADASLLLGMLPAVESARFVRELVVTRPVAEGEFDFGPTITALGKALPAFRALRRLTIGQFSSDESELSWAIMGKLDELWPHLPKLEYLKLRAGSMRLGRLALPSCRELRIETGGLDRDDLRSILAADWPHLETLSLWFGRADYGANCTLEDVAHILDANKFPSLVHLGLANFEWGNELAPLIVASDLLPRLRTLDVSMSHLTRNGLVTYRAAREKLAHLELLNLAECLLDDEGKTIATSLAPNVKLEHQRDPDDYETGEYRYAAVGE